MTMPRTHEATADPPRTERLLTKAEAAEVLNVTLRFVNRCVVERRVRFVRVGRHIRIPASALDEFIAEQTVPPVR
jgi:excisionase family DNA binding protein